MKNLIQTLILIVAVFYLLPLTSQVVTIGNGTIVNNDDDYPAPYGNYYEGARHQFLVLASELQSAGATAGTIHSVAFDVVTPAGIPLTGFTVKIGYTVATSLSDFHSNLTTVYASTYTETSGWNTHNFTSGFYWDGVSNIVVETCFNNTNWNKNARLNQSITGFNSTFLFFEDFMGVCQIPVGLGLSLRPNMQFDITPAGPCTDPPVAGTVVSSVSKACKDVEFQLSTSGTSTGSGLSYQWQISSDDVTWTDITGANASVLFTSQSSDSYYRLQVTCNTMVSSSSLFMEMENFNNCYCESMAFVPEDTEIGHVSLNTINNTSTTTCDTYTDFTSISTTLTKGETYPISISQASCGGFYPAFIKVYIDYNQDGVFDEFTEEVFSYGPTIQLGAVTGNITIPLTAETGPTRMRIVMSEDSDFLAACGLYGFGETEDYTVIIAEGNPCIDPPVGGTAVASVASACSGETFLLSLSGHSTGTGQTYQWQVSTDNTNWTDITGAVFSNYTATMANTAWYRAVLTCGTSVQSSAVEVTAKPATECYCNSAATYSDDSKIENVTFAMINNTAPAGCATYSDFTGVSTEVKRGETYTISVTHGSCDDFYSAYVAVYIDYNRNGEFTSAERVFSAGPTNSLGEVLSGTVVIPSTAQNGPTRMRVILSEDPINSPCGFYDYGETQDYTIVVTPGVGINDKPLENQLAIYPNPVSGMLFIDMELQKPGSFVAEVYDITGRKVISHRGKTAGSEQLAIDVSHLENGSYLVKVLMEDQIRTEKILIIR